MDQNTKTPSSNFAALRVAAAILLLAVLCTVLFDNRADAKQPPTVSVTVRGIRMTSTAAVTVEVLDEATAKGGPVEITSTTPGMVAPTPATRRGLFQSPWIRNALYILVGLALVPALNFVKPLLAKAGKPLEGRAMFLVTVAVCTVFAIGLGLVFRDGARPMMFTNPLAAAAGGGWLWIAGQALFRLAFHR